MEITYQTDHGILQIEPDGALQEKDFENLATELEHLQKDQRDLNGLLVLTENFPGYEKFTDLLAHGKFVSEHADSIPRVALCTDSAVGGLLKTFGDTFTSADVRKFDYSDKDQAEKWILSQGS